MVLLQSFKTLLYLLLSAKAVVGGETTNIGETVFATNKLPQNKGQLLQRSADVGNWLEKASKEFIKEFRILTNPVEISRADISVIAGFSLNTSTLLVFVESTRKIVEKAGFPEANSCIDDVSQKLVMSATVSATAVNATAVLGRYLKNDKSYRMVKKQNDTARQACSSVLNKTQELIDGVSTCHSSSTTGLGVVRNLPSWKQPLNRLCLALVHQLQISRFVNFPLCRILLADTFVYYESKFSNTLAAIANDVFVDHDENPSSISPVTATAKSSTANPQSSAVVPSTPATRSLLKRAEILPVAGCVKMSTDSGDSLPNRHTIENAVNEVTSGFKSRSAIVLAKALAEKLNDMFKGLHWRIIVTRGQYKIHPSGIVQPYNAYHDCTELNAGDSYGSYDVSFLFSDIADSAWLIVNWLSSQTEPVPCDIPVDSAIRNTEITASNGKSLGEMFGDANVSATAICHDLSKWVQKLCKSNNEMKWASVLIEENAADTAVVVSSTFGVITVNDYSSSPVRRITFLADGALFWFRPEVRPPVLIDVTTSPIALQRLAAMFRDRSAWELIYSNAFEMLRSCKDIASSSFAGYEPSSSSDTGGSLDISTEADAVPFAPELEELCRQLATSTEIFGDAFVSELHDFASTTQSAERTGTLDHFSDLTNTPLAKAGAIMEKSIIPIALRISSQRFKNISEAQRSLRLQPFNDAATAFNHTFQRFGGFQRRLIDKAGLGTLKTKESVSAYLAANAILGKLLHGVSNLFERKLETNSSRFSDVTQPIVCNRLLCPRNSSTNQSIARLKDNLANIISDVAKTTADTILHHSDAKQILESLNSAKHSSIVTVAVSPLVARISLPCTTDVPPELTTKALSIATTTGERAGHNLAKASKLLDKVSMSMTAYDISTDVLRLGPERHMGPLFVSTVEHLIHSLNEDNDKLRKICAAAHMGFGSLHNKIETAKGHLAITNVPSHIANALSLVEVTPDSELDYLVDTPVSIVASAIMKISTTFAEATRSLDETISNLSTVQTTATDADFTTIFSSRKNSQQFHNHVADVRNFHTSTQKSCIEFILRLPFDHWTAGLQCMHTIGFVVLSVGDLHYVNKCDLDGPPAATNNANRMARIVISDLVGISSKIQQHAENLSDGTNGQVIVDLVNQTILLFLTNVQHLPRNANMVKLSEDLVALLANERSKPPNLPHWKKILKLVISNATAVMRDLGGQLQSWLTWQYIESGSRRSLSDERTRAQLYRSRLPSITDMETCFKSLYNDEVKRIKENVAATLSSGSTAPELESSLKGAQQALWKLQGQLGNIGEFFSRLSTIYNTSTSLESGVFSKALTSTTKPHFDQINSAWIRRYKASLRQTLLTFSEIVKLADRFIRNFNMNLNAGNISTTMKVALPVIKKLTKDELARKASEMQSEIELSNAALAKESLDQILADVTGKLLETDATIGSVDPSAGKHALLY